MATIGPARYDDAEVVPTAYGGRPFRPLPRTPMSRPSGDDREAIDRAFDDLVAGYHLTSDRPDPLDGAAGSGGTSPALSPTPVADATDSAGHHPLFRYVGKPEPDDESEPQERFVPEPPPPLPKPAWPVLIAWIGMGYSVLAVLAVVLGARLPGWAGWLAVAGFVAAFGILVTRLPRHRPPDAGDGAVL